VALLDGGRLAIAVLPFPFVKKTAFGGSSPILRHLVNARVFPEDRRLDGCANPFFLLAAVSP
jgi:hypothetical protein